MGEAWQAAQWHSLNSSPRGRQQSRWLEWTTWISSMQTVINTSMLKIKIKTTGRERCKGVQFYFFNFWSVHKCAWRGGLLTIQVSSQLSQTSPIAWRLSRVRREKTPAAKKKPPLFNPKPFFPNPKLWRRKQSCRAAATAKDSFNPHVRWILDSTTSCDFFHNSRASKEGDKEGASVLATLLSCFRAGAGRMLM